MKYSFIIKNGKAKISNRSKTIVTSFSLLLGLITSARAQFEIIGVSWSFTNSSVVRIAPNTGAEMQIGLSGFERLNSLARSPGGGLYSVGGADSRSLIAIDPATGAGQFQIGLNFGAVSVDVRGLAFSPAGVLYAINDATAPLSDYLFTINPVTGAGTLVGVTGMPGLQGLDFAPDGTLYGWDVGSGSGTGAGLVRIDPLTGLATDVNSSVSGSYLIQSIVFAPDGTLYGAGDALYRINVTTGEPTVIGPGGYPDLRGIEVVPEPSSLLLLACGGLAVLRRWLKRKNDYPAA